VSRNAVDAVHTATRQGGMMCELFTFTYLVLIFLHVSSRI